MTSINQITHIASFPATSKADLDFKVIVIGNNGVGKSCLSLKATSGRYEENYIATVGFEFFTYAANVVNDTTNKTIRLQIWDTCGQETYRSIVVNFYRNSTLAILVYSIDDIDSFNAIEMWVKQLKMYSNPDVKVFLIGNKSDLESSRVVTKEMGEKCKRDYKFDLFMETSAKTGFNSEEVFITAIRMLYDEYMKYNSTIKSNPTVEKKVKKNNRIEKEIKKSSGCC